MEQSGLLVRRGVAIGEFRAPEGANILTRELPAGGTLAITGAVYGGVAGLGAE